jgi:hypothetical protein
VDLAIEAMQQAVTAGSSDPEHVAFARTVVGHLWLLDFATNVVSQLTNGPGSESDPTWSHDERRIAFTARRNGPPTILQKPTVFQKDLITGIEQPLVLDPQPLGAVVDDWSAGNATHNCKPWLT